MNKNVIIGLGTGRCGTVSLSKLLNAQKNSYFSHEWGGAHAWNSYFNKFSSYIDHMQYEFCGDVAFYNLPYVSSILELYPNAKFIILKRDKNETIKSYMNKTKETNHWEFHDGKKFKYCDWDHCYPKFEARDKSEAIGMYWEYYYKECSKINPKNCFYISTDELNDEKKCLELLNWCGFTKPIYRLSHFNKSNYKLSDNSKNESTKYLTGTKTYTVQDVTICIKTFERPHCLEACVKTIRKQYPDIKIIAVDDSEAPGKNEQVTKYITMPYDSGLSAGRNLAVKNVTTPLTMIVDDDTMFTTDKCIESMLDIYNKSNEINLVAGRLFPTKEKEWHGKYIINNRDPKRKILEMHFGKCNKHIKGHAIFDVVINLFISDTKLLQENPWNENLKIAEHAEWFWRMREKLNCTICDEAMFKNTADKSNPKYAKMRQRTDFWKKQCEVIGVTKIELKR